MSARAVAKVFLAVEKAEGAGARVRRSIGVPQLRNFSPFLMLDHFSVADGAGFPDHPHSGQETITYMLTGSIQHEDFTGASGTINAGDLQFMTAGRGIVHAEIPASTTKDGLPSSGLQLWADLPESLKQCEPRYRDLLAQEIPEIHPSPEVDIKIISGESHGTESVQELAYTPIWIFDITIRPGGSVTQPLPLGWNAFIYTLSGTVGVGAKTVPQYHNIVFSQAGDHVEVSVAKEATEPARIVLVAGTPLDQKVVQYGPFVQTSQQGIMEVFENYQGFKNGFERAKNWESKIAAKMMGRA